MYASIEELVSDATIKNLPISELVIQAECNDMNVSRNDVWRKMKHNLDTMRLAVSRGAHGIGVHSKTGLTGGDAVKIKDYRKSHKTLSGDMIMSAVQSAIATNEVNAAMGVICATPTAGSSGTLPGVLFTLEKRLGLDEEQMVRFLFTAGGFKEEHE